MNIRHYPYYTVLNKFLITKFQYLRFCFIFNFINKNFCYIVLDKTALDDIYPFLNELKEDPHRSGIIEMLIHEQYFYPHYRAYQPEYRDKILTAARWAAENEYEPAFWSDIVLEK
jgi:hypothetical protein